MGIFLPPLEFIQADPSRRDLMGMTPLRVVLAQESRRRRFALVGVEVMVGDTASGFVYLNGTSHPHVQIGDLFLH